MINNILRLILAASFVSMLQVHPAMAQAKYSIKEMTPVVESALNSRRDRFEQLKALKANGTIGENNKGYVEVVAGDATAADVVAAENKDRKVIYQTIADQNGLNDELSTIEKVFADVQRDKASSGDKIQSEDGSWITK